MFTRKFDASLARMHLLSKLYPDTKARAEVEKDLKESAQWMGQLIGYLEGPAKKAIAAETVAANKQAIMSELSGQWRQTFDAGKQQVLDQFFQLQDELVKKRAQALEDEKKEKATELESIAQERSRITSELDNLKSKGDASKTEMDGKLSEIDKYLAPVARRARDLKFRADPVLRRMRDLKVRIGRAEADERNAGDDRNRRDRARRDGDLLRNEFRREQIRLRPIDTEMRRVQGEGARLVSQRAAAQSRYQISLRSLTIQRKKLERTVKSLDKKERIVSKPATGRSPKVSDLERRLTALSTYRAFPLEEARISLLESARK